ncbi:MAG TPA: FecR domain-containing protein [Anaeromyxobacteraceae bacterium]|nr:FecR domain-containing protein [Anaeromyxobacteraceae bacterium]
MRTRARSSRLVGAGILALLLCPAPIRADGDPPGVVARAVSVQGTVESQRAGAAAWAPVKLDDTFSPGDAIRVGKLSRADLVLLDQSVLRLDAETTLTLRPVEAERTGVLDLLRGAVHFFSRGPRSLEVRTEFVAAGVRGTEFLVQMDADAARVLVFEGTVLAQNPRGSVTLVDGQSAVAERGAGPVLRAVARPRDAVRWTLYYPAVLYPRPEQIPPEAGPQGRLRESIEAYRRGDLQAAFAAIADVPATASDPRFLTYRAQLSLAVGRVDEAAADLERALAAAPGDAHALSLQAIAAVVQNEKDRALELARKAVETAPASSTALVALSYAQQARFDLEGARSSLERAVEADPQDALAWARLAELHSSFGERGKALEAAEKAAALAPDLSRAQTVLGFGYLADVKVARARAAFEKAIALDSADPLPRLGRGLAIIRAGDLDRGAREIEIAASLDPSSSLFRSYLGKAYYEEKRTGLDEREYAMAKQLDPLDPTPWLYDAIAKQTTNRPVEALRDLDRAIELNDNRAVYRSRLLLDADLAARSASLARIYSDLGFQQAALVEGWKSVAADPTSDSAHRLLADSYAALPRHEVARVSELLQAQLLQPINLTPIQPRLGESNLFLIGQGGPGALSFHEFNPLFNRDRLALQLSGLGGEHATYGVEPVLAGVYRNLSVSAGYTHFETKGVRVNNDQTEDIADAFVQGELSSSTSLEAEYRHRTSHRGDLQPYFFPELVRTTVRNHDDWDTYRLGARHAFSPGSIVLASATYQKATFRFEDPGLVASDKSQDAAGGELQYLFRSRYVDLATGGGYFDLSGDVRLQVPPQQIDQTTPQGAWHADGYAYAHVHLPTSLVLTLGVSGDVFRSRDTPDLDKEQVNPKVGISWSPLSGTTVRAAAFRVLKRTLITDQTLELVQIAGFNQFFDDPDGTTSWRYGVGVDQRLTRDLAVGIEGSIRDLTAPAIDLTVGAFVPVSWKEYDARGYVFWTPHRSLALRAEYFFERIVGDERLTLGAVEANTHRVPLGLALFLPYGLSASATLTYYHQEGTFDALAAFGQPGFAAGSDDFWLVDAGLSWRLPQRYGFIGVSATNLLDEQFHLFELNTRINTPIALPARTVLGRITLAVP